MFKQKTRLGWTGWVVLVLGPRRVSASESIRLGWPGRVTFCRSLRPQGLVQASESMFKCRTRLGWPGWVVFSSSWPLKGLRQVDQVRLARQSCLSSLLQQGLVQVSKSMSKCRTRLGWAGLPWHPQGQVRHVDNQAEDQVRLAKMAGFCLLIAQAFYLFPRK